MSKYKLTQSVELHQSLWLEDMKNYTVSDFLPGGRITNDATILNGSDEVISNLSKHFWNVIFLTDTFVEDGLGCQGFMYLVDTENGLSIFHTEPVRRTESVNKPVNLRRATL